MKTMTFLLSAWIAPATILHAGPRSSASYSIPMETIDAGGIPVTSARYSHVGSAGGIPGLSTAGSTTVKSGYIGQIFEPAALTLAGTPPTVNETATTRVSAQVTLDDATFLAAGANDVEWSILTGPLTIDSAGLATAGVVFEDTAATVQGVFAGTTGTLPVSVVNALPDNFGSYAGDSLDDDWQVHFFGLNNPRAGPLIDADQDGFDNLFEFRAGIIPTDPLSVFQLRMEPVPGQPGHKRILFSPRLPDRTYSVQAGQNLLSSSWISLSNFTVSDNGSERTVTDLDAGTARKFYRVEITRP